MAKLVVVYWKLRFEEVESGEDDCEFITKLEELARGKCWFVKGAAIAAKKPIEDLAKTFFLSSDGTYPRRLPKVEALLIKVRRTVGKE